MASSSPIFGVKIPKNMWNHLEIVEEHITTSLSWTFRVLGIFESAENRGQVQEG